MSIDKPSSRQKPKEIMKENLVTSFHILRSVNPRNGIEGMLAPRMIGTHNMAMEMMVGWVSSTKPAGVDQSVNRIRNLRGHFLLKRRL